VIKLYSKAKLPPSKREAIEREERILRAVEGPGVIQLHTLLETEDACHLVMEACTGLYPAPQRDRSKGFKFILLPSMSQHMAS